MESEAAGRATFTEIRYGQCWEDADILLDGLDIRPGDVCVSIASAGDNALAMASKGPERIVALDLSSAQLACLELRIAAYRTLEHGELLELIGSSPSDTRPVLYRRCRKSLSTSATEFWDAHSEDIGAGIGGAGKFERYFGAFRSAALPLVHPKKTVDHLLQAREPEDRKTFYTKTWDTWRWRMLFRIFFSRTVMGRLGRDPSFFRYVEGGVADRILERTRYALTELAPSENPYLQWILTGTHTTALPYALRPENFDAIRNNVHRLELYQEPLEAHLERLGTRAIDRFNLSDIFEYMSEENYETLLRLIVQSSRPGARLAYWNMLAPRSRPASMARQLESLSDLSAELFKRDKAFFYSNFVVEEVL